VSDKGDMKFRVSFAPVLNVEEVATLELYCPNCLMC